MANRKPKAVQFRRRREGKTSYKKRKQLLISRKLRLVVRFTNQKIIAQLIKFESQGDKVILGLDSYALKKLGWNYSCKNIPAAYLTGLLLAKEGLKKGQKEAVLDIGFRYPLKGSKLYAFLKGALDGGLNVPSGEGIFPMAERIEGQHIKGYAENMKEKELVAKRFSKYLKNNALPDKITEKFSEIKTKIIG